MKRLVIISLRLHCLKLLRLPFCGKHLNALDYRLPGYALRSFNVFKAAAVVLVFRLVLVKAAHVI
jgi:hypothetical protein